MKKLYAITDMNAKFIKTMEFASQKQVEDYLNRMYGQGKSRVAYPLSSSKKKLSKTQIKVLEHHIDALKSQLNTKDIRSYHKLLNTLKERPAAEGMIIIYQDFDTYLRETIPDDIWNAMVGKQN